MTNTQTTKISTGKKILYAIIILLICFILLEMVLRIVGVDSRKESPFFLLLRVHEYPEYFQRHPTLFWELVPNKIITGKFIAEGVYHINSHGFRGPDFEDKKPNGTIRICCIGNSCTFGWEIPEGKTYAELLEKELAERYPDQKFEVINCGVPGYSSHQGLVLLKEKILGYNPDIITLSFGWNDIWGAGRGITDREQKIMSPFVIWLQNSLAKLQTYRMMKYMILELTEKKGIEGFNFENPSYRVSLEEYRENLMEIQRTATENGIIPIFMTSPAPDARTYFGTGARSQLDEFFLIHDEYNKVILNLRDQNRFWVVPLATYFENQPGFFDPTLKDYIHYNQAGHEYVARILAQFMKRYMLIDNMIDGNNLENK
jgi:lysophospholipase L1-like esterase